MSILKELKENEQAGWVRSQRHPYLPLSIWNYTEQTQFDGHWNETTLSCRGLVVNDDGAIQALPLQKFFNIEEAKHTPTTNFEVFDKVDGSLLILFYYEGDWIFATRGSFTSEQAIRAKVIASRWPTTSIEELDPRFTFLFEIVYPENRIVVDYGDKEELVLLTAINPTNRKELSYNDLHQFYSEYFTVVTRYDRLDYKNIQKLNTPNSEGFVVKFDNGQRCKIKFADYVRLHRIMTDLSTTTVYEKLRFGHDINDWLKDVPDEFYKHIKEYADELTTQYNYMETEARLRYYAISNLKNRKKFAAEALTCPEYSSIMFSMRDDKDYSQIIWKTIKPEYRKL